MAFFRSYIAPLLVVLVFLVALAATSARIFLSGDMAAPAPMTEAPAVSFQVPTPDEDAVAGLPPSLSSLVRGLPDSPSQF
jgi:hypothetical protein